MKFTPATTTTVDGKILPARNALWFTSGMEHFTDLRLEFNIVDPLREFRDWLNPAGDNDKLLLDNFSINSVTLVARKSWRMQDNGNENILADSTASFEFRLDVTLASVQFTAYLSVSTGVITLRLQHDQPGDSLLQILFDWIYNAGLGVNKDNFEAAQWTKSATDRNFLGAIRPRVFEISLACNEKGIPTGLISLKLDLQIEVTIGKTSDQKDKALGKVVVPAPPTPNDLRLALPEYEKYLNLTPVLGDQRTLLPTLDLVALAGLQTSMPKGIPSTVSLAELEIDAKGIYFKGELICAEPEKGKSPKNVPVFVLDRLLLNAGFSWGGNNSGSKWLFRLEIDTLLYLENDRKGETAWAEDNEIDGAEPVQLRGTLEFSSDHWEVSADVNLLMGSHLASFFDEDSQNGALSLLGHLSIEYLHLKYEYMIGKDAEGSRFEFDGSMTIGTLKLGVAFHHQNGGWEFTVKLGVDDPQDPKSGVTLGGLLEGIMGSEIPELPDAVREIPIAKPGKADELLRFSCSKTDGPLDKDKKPTKMIVLVASVHLASVSLTFVQWRVSTWPREIPSKRIIKIAVNEIGPLEAPLVGKIDQLPIEEIAYVWVSDKVTADKSKAGITRGEFDKLVPKLQKQDRLFYKPPKQDPTKIADGDRVIEAGSHFMVISKDANGVSTAMLDHVFGRPRPHTPGKPEFITEEERRRKLVYRWNNILLPRENDPNPLPRDASQVENKDVSKAPFKLSVGPLSIENIGLQFDLKKQRLGIVLDATFIMGPIGLALIGFSLSARLGKRKKSDEDDDKDKQNEGSGIPVSELAAGLQGLLVSFDRPPVTVAGGLMQQELDGFKCYAGGLTIGFKPWIITAMGIYASVPKNPADFPTFMTRHARPPRLQSSQVYELDVAEEILEEERELLALDDQRHIETFTMVFVIMRVEGPLFSVGFADISGLTGGVGVNTEMRLPTADTVLSFPFVNPSGSVSDPNASPLKSLMALLAPPQGRTWFSPREGSFWFAAGLKATAFQMLSVDAVVVVQLNPDIQLGIYGVAVCDVPTLVSSVKFVHVELGIACTLDVAAGAFKLEAQLSPRSFILHNSCHLTGGMALFSWFAPRVPSPDKDIQALQGDWVLTIGGYHQAYNKPRAYPNPPRLAINWTLSSALRISGEAYFAITPRVCMAGGRLHATLNLGALSAWFDAFLDLLLNFEPFYFRAVGGVSVGIKFSMDLWLVTVHISAEIGATLTVAGPPMAGMVHVDFWVFGFDINFGGSMQSRPIALKLPRFIDLVLKSGTNGSSSGFLLPTMPNAEEERDWVALDETDEDAFFKNVKKEDDKKKTAKPFLFNCTSGLVPTPKVPGQKTTSSPPLMSAETEDRNLWTVQPGTFIFSITCAFASSSGTFMDKRPDIPEDKIEQPMKGKVFREEHDNIYAKPMCLETRAGVKIEVTIAQKESDSVQLRRAKTGFRTLAKESKEGVWKVEPIIKAVPTSVWGKYDLNHDPSLQGNNVGTLLAGTNEKDKGTVPLVMGLTIAPPIPTLSHDKLEKFNVVEDTKITVERAVLPEGDNANEAWLPRGPDDPFDPSTQRLSQVSQLENPQDPPAGGDDEELKRWQNVKDVWWNQKNDPENAVELWSSRLQFAEGALSGKRPTNLLRRFNQMVPALPMVAMGVR
ncbi:hypothetical protein PT974_12273 [Cladobotryum mycophilum]|uniref:DUF6603 domain-containing protein n=1 Tax=Cladobotryum mycophilum TaxID=491253 RepID=A0ABR0S7I8_9HYPO